MPVVGDPNVCKVSFVCIPPLHTAVRTSLFVRRITQRVGMVDEPIGTLK